jgi:oligopeptide/dipeptide ABC transporter ATP-binding protein
VIGQRGGGVVLSVDGLSVVARRGGLRVPILADVRLDVHRSEIIGIVGESGSGKSTLARAISRLLPESLNVTSGTITLNGRDILHARPSTVHRIRPGGLSMVFQSPINALNPLLPVGSQVAEAFRVTGLSRREALSRSVEILERMGIKAAASRLDEYPHQFSGGQRQRIVIGIALAARPAVLIADEPTSALDVTTQASILEMFAEIARENSTAIIFVSHNYAVVSNICSRVLVLYAGRTMELGQASALLADPRHPYTSALIDSLPSIDRRVEALKVIPGSPPRPGELRTGCPFRVRCDYARAECETGSIELRPVGLGHDSACLRVDEIWGAPTSRSSEHDGRSTASV